MGTSNWQNISYCTEAIFKLAPNRTLDVGIGSMGRWALLVREFVDVWRGNVLSEDWQCTIDGIEAFPDQLGEHHYQLYDHIYKGDALKLIDQMDYYDLIILGDILEHFPSEQAKPMLLKCLDRSRTVMVNTPLGDLDDWPQDSLYGNKYEQHQSVWQLDDFLACKRWKVLEHKLFRDYIGRPFGVFLLRSARLRDSRLAPLEQVS